MERQELLDKLNAIAKPVDLVAWKERIHKQKLKREQIMRSLATQMTVDIYKAILVEMNGYTEEMVEEMYLDDFYGDDLWDKIYGVVEKGLNK